MNLVDRMLGFIGLTRKSADLSALIDKLEKKGGLRDTYDSYVNDGYKKNGTAYGSINQIAINAATVPWIGFRTMPNEETRELPRMHPLMRLINRPNQKNGWARFVERMMIHLYVSGEAYILKIVTTRGRTKELWNLRPDGVNYQKEGDPDSGWSYQPDKSKQPQLFEPDEVLPLYLIDPSNDLQGLSPIGVASTTINQSNFSREWNQQILKNQGRPPGILRNEEGLPIDEEEVKKIINRFGELYGGYENAGKPVVLQGKLSWQRTGLTPGEMEWLEGQRVADRNTSFTIGVPSVLTGDNESATHRNYEEARKALYQDKIVPLLQWFRDELNVWLVPEFGKDLRLDIEEDAIDALQEDRKDHWERVSRAQWLTINEQREATNFDSLGDPGDVIITQRGIVITKDDVYIPATLIPLGSDQTNGNTAGKQLPCGCGEHDDETSIVTLAGLKQQSTSVQSVVCAKSVFPALSDAKSWTSDHGFKTSKTDETSTSWRFRQFDPEQCTSNSFRTISLARGVSAVICKKKKAKEDEPEHEPTLCFWNCPADRKTGHWKVVEREREPFFRLAKLRALRELRADGEAVVAAIKSAGFADVDVIIDSAEARLIERERDWAKFYDTIYLAIGEHFARRVLSAIPDFSVARDWAVAAAACSGWKQDDDFFDPFATEIRRYLSTQAGSRIVGIRKTTLGRVRRELTAGVEAGEGTDKLASRVDRFLAKIYAHRAETVARTEVLTASNLASDVAARATGVAQKKEWIATPDERTRDDHRDADDQVVAMDDPFVVGGHQLMFPGDTSLGAPAGQIIQCRCATGYITE